MLNITGAIIGMKVGNVIKVLLVQHGGHIYNTGRVLLKKYNNAASIEGLLRLNEVSFLMLNKITKTKDKPIKLEFKNYDEFQKKAFEMKCSNVYFFDVESKRWFYSFNKRFIILSDLLPKNLF